MELMIPQLEKFAKEGLFGEINLLRVSPSTDDNKSAQFQSQMGFFEVDLVTRKGKVRKVPVAVKLQLDTVQTPSETDQFANEVIAYEKVLRDLGATNMGIHPTMYYAHANGKDPKQDLLILEDLRPQGFKAPAEVNLDYDHINLALKKLGVFHGLSYKMKNSSPEKFKELKDLLVPRKVWDSQGYNEIAIKRGFAIDLESTPDYSVLNRAYKKLISKSSKELTESLQVPEEPFAVIVHGDFLLNNLLYKYDEGGRPQEVKFFDFATAMYSDPSIDIALFLYMHTTEDRKHWNEHLKSYWEGVTSVDNPGFTYDQFILNFSKKAVYGYVISSYFLPLMQNPDDFHLFGRKENGDCSGVRPGSWADIDRTPVEGRNTLAMNYGGDKSTDSLRSIVQHLLKEGYLEEYLLHMK